MGFDMLSVQGNHYMRLNNASMDWIFRTMRRLGVIDEPAWPPPAGVYPDDPHPGIEDEAAVDAWEALHEAAQAQADATPGDGAIPAWKLWGVAPYLIHPQEIRKTLARIDALDNPPTEQGWCDFVAYLRMVADAGGFRP